MKVMKFCKYCGKKYYVEKSQEKRSKFCSDKCFRANNNKQVEYCCDYCGTPFMITSSQVEKVKNGVKKGLYCSPQCAKDVQKPKWSDIKSLFDEHDYELVSTEYINAKTKLEYICNKHRGNGIQSVTYNNLKHGFGCAYCGNERTVEAKRLPFDEVVKIFESTDKTLLEQPYINVLTPLAYICNHHPEIGVQYMSTDCARKQFCPYCNIVKGEYKIAKYFIENDILFNKYKTYDGLLGVKGGKLSYDFYVPKYNLLIEFQGEQHEHPVEYFGGETQFQIQLEHDKRKKEYAISHNIDFLEIWYYEYNNVESIIEDKLKQIA